MCKESVELLKFLNHTYAFEFVLIHIEGVFQGDAGSTHVGSKGAATAKKSSGFSWRIRVAGNTQRMFLSTEIQRQAKY
jgi:hypothetical protein